MANTRVWQCTEGGSAGGSAGGSVRMQVAIRSGGVQTAVTVVTVRFYCRYRCMCRREASVVQGSNSRLLVQVPVYMLMPVQMRLPGARAECQCRWI
jgi:hypothetical protein